MLGFLFICPCLYFIHPIWSDDSVVLPRFASPRSTSNENIILSKMFQDHNQEVHFKLAIMIYNIEDSINDSEYKMTSEEMLSVTCCKSIIGFGVRI